MAAAWQGTHSTSFSWGVTQLTLTRTEGRKWGLLVRVPTQRMAKLIWQLEAKREKELKSILFEATNLFPGSANPQKAGTI